MRPSLVWLSLEKYLQNYLSDYILHCENSDLSIVTGDGLYLLVSFTVLWVNIVTRQAGINIFIIAR